MKWVLYILHLHYICLVLHFPLMTKIMIAITELHLNWSSSLYRNKLKVLICQQLEHKMSKLNELSKEILEQFRWQRRLIKYKIVKMYIIHRNQIRQWRKTSLCIFCGFFDNSKTSHGRFSLWHFLLWISLFTTNSQYKRVIYWKHTCLKYIKDALNIRHNSIPNLITREHHQVNYP